MRFCVIGAGNMGARHIANISASKRARLAYVVDPDEVRAKEMAARYNVAYLGDPAEALADRTVDAVIIASATNTHVDLIVAAAKAGKAILCEKPIDLDMARVEACANSIKGSNVPIMIGFQRRFDPTHQEVKAAVEHGEIGRIEVITIVSRDPGPPPVAYIKTSGGQFHDQMIHDFDMALWMSSATGLVTVFAMAGNLVDPEIGRAGDSDTAQVLMRFESGAFCRIDCSRRAVYGYDQRVEIFGSKGMVCSGNVRSTSIERYNAKTTSALDSLKPDFMARYLPTYALELDTFIDAVTAGSQVSPDFECGRRALMLADAARESSRTAQPVLVHLGEP
jgi:myo-inositol 2-dehydrogenase / D-chiro-inositol 1-dehydrogenase